MARTRLSRRILLILLLLLGSVGWIGYRAVHQSALDHALIVASRRGDPLTVRTLLDQGADPNAREDRALQTGWRHPLQLLLHHKQNSMRLCSLGQSLASGEMDSNHFEIVRLLLTHHANPNTILSDGTPIPMRVVETVQTQGVQYDDRLLPLFLEHGANPNTVDSVGTSLLMYAANAHKDVWVRALLDHGAKPDSENATGDDALMWAASYRDNKSIALLLSHGANVNHKNKKGANALTYTMVHENKGQIPTIEILLAAGADVNAPDSQGCTPFLLALATQNFVNDRLLARGGDVRRAIPASALPQNVTVQIQMEGSSMTMGMTSTWLGGTTPLMFAAHLANVDLVRKMLAKGADVNARDAKGGSALYYAEASGSTARYEAGNTKTDYSRDASEICALLQRAGARR